MANARAPRGVLAQAADVARTGPQPSIYTPVTSAPGQWGPEAAQAFAPATTGVPATGFLGPQRTASGQTATVMNMTVGLDDKHWVIPSLTPNQHPNDLKALLSEKRLDMVTRRRILDRAVEFALAHEEKYPGTFPKYDTPEEAIAASMRGSEQKGQLLQLQTLPEGRWPLVPGP